MDASLQSQMIEAVLNKRSRPPFPYIRGNPCNAFGDMIMVNPLLCVTAAVSLVALTSVAQARSAYDGSVGALLFVTQRGACDPTYNFLRQHHRWNRHPSKSGEVQRLCGALGCRSCFGNRSRSKYAAGSGRLSSNSGGGRWSGYSGNARCSGYWTAQRN